MGLFFKKKSKKSVPKSHEEIMDEIIEFNIKNAQDEEQKRYYEAQADKEYQKALSTIYELLAEIRESYTVIRNVGSFTGEAADKLIERCVLIIDIDNSIQEKKDYYETTQPNFVEPYKTLSIIYEKRGEYQRAASACVMAIQKGYIKDGSYGGMRGRLARLIKEGNLPLSDCMKNILNL